MFVKNCMLKMKMHGYRVIIFTIRTTIVNLSVLMQKNENIYCAIQPLIRPLTQSVPVMPQHKD